MPSVGKPTSGPSASAQEQRYRLDLGEDGSVKGENMARRSLVHWPRQSAESRDVWSSTSDRALDVILRYHSPDAVEWRRGESSSLIDRLMPIAMIAILAFSGLTIGWVLFVP